MLFIQDAYNFYVDLNIDGRSDPDVDFLKAGERCQSEVM